MTTFGKIKLDKDGTWFHNEAKVVHEKTAKLFYKSIIKKDNDYFLKVDNQKVPIEVEDVALWVTNIELNKDKSEIKLFLSDETIDFIKDNNFKLEINKENLLYCYLKDNWKTKFTRNAYYAITDCLTEKDSKFFIELGGLNIRIDEV